MNKFITHPFRTWTILSSILLIAVSGCAYKQAADQQIGGARDSVDGSGVDTIRVLAYNIHHGAGMDEVLDLNRIAALIRSVEPDVVTLQEIDSVTARTNAVDQAVELGRLTGLTPLFGRFMAYDGGAYGMALLSRWPIDSSRNIRLPDGEEPRSALSAVITSPTTGRKYQVVGIHFYRTEEERMAQTLSLEDQLAADRSSAETRREMPTILAGDFNSTPDSKIIGHLATSWDIVDKGEDHFTFSSFDPYEEIDFIMTRPVNAFTVAQQWLIDEPVASDHRPMMVVLVAR